MNRPRLGHELHKMPITIDIDLLCIIPQLLNKKINGNFDFL